jgi:hypothetical protein
MKGGRSDHLHVSTTSLRDCGAAMIRRAPPSCSHFPTVIARGIIENVEMTHGKTLPLRALAVMSSKKLEADLCKSAAALGGPISPSDIRWEGITVLAPVITLYVKRPGIAEAIHKFSITDLIDYDSTSVSGQDLIRALLRELKLQLEH